MSGAHEHSFAPLEWTPTPTPATPTPFARPPSGVRAPMVEGPVFTPGVTIGVYRVIRMIGRGDVSEVYEVEHVDLARRYALKILAEERRVDGLARRRFEREAKVVASIEHPNVIRVQHMDRLPDGRRYLVTELLRGRTLAERLANGRLPIAEACFIAEQIAAALDAAHARGALHRDLTPANVFLADTEAGQQVKLMDFGQAKIEVAAEDELTFGAELVGTPGYVAPEQISRSTTLDARADLYALGVLLFEMLTGAPPFRAADERALLDAHETSPAPDPRELRVDIPTSVAQLTLACLAKSPDGRPRSARDVHRLLRTLRKRPQAARVKRPGRTSQLLIAASAAVLLIAITVVVTERALTRPSAASSAR